MKFANTFSFKVHALTYAIDYLANQVLKKNSTLNFPQFLILLCYTQNPGQTQKFGAQWLQITEATVSYMVKKMFRQGYLSFVQDKDDHRIKHLFPSQQCIDSVQKLYPLLEKALSKHLYSVADQDMKVSLKVMDQLMDSLKTEYETPPQSKHT
jgi:DNA-binding MarR family transcriptional regulator